MTKKNVLMGAATLGLAIAFGGMAFAGEIAASLEKTVDIYEAAVGLSGVNLGEVTLSSLTLDARTGEDVADSASLRGVLVYGDFLSVVAEADVNFATDEKSLAFAADATNVQTSFGQLTLGLALDDTAASVSAKLVNASYDFNDGEVFSFEFSKENGGETSAQVGAGFIADNGMTFSFDADLATGDANLNFSYQF